MIYILILPVLEELASVIIQTLEILKGKAMIKVQTTQNVIAQLAKSIKEDEKQTTHIIGFQLPEEDNEDEEDQDEDE